MRGLLFISFIFTFFMIISACNLHNPFQETTYKSVSVSTSEPTTDLTPEPTLDLTPASTLDLSPEPTLDLTPASTTDLSPEPTLDFTPEPTLVPTPEPTPESTPTLPTGKYQDYTYILPIDLTEKSGNNVTDYQILIPLNSGNFNYTHVTDPNGNDIRFDIDDTECSYWIETWDTNGDSKIWVKIPDLNSNQSKILYMFYGYASAAQMSNGDDTFLLFDDFNDNLLDSAKWTDISQNPAAIKEEGQVLFCKMADPQQVRGFARSTNEIPESNIALHLRSQFENQIESTMLAIIHFDGNRSGVYDYPTNGYSIDWTHTDGNVRLEQFVDSTNTLINSVSKTRDLTWHNFQFRYYNQTLEVISDGSTLLSETSTQLFNTKYIGLASREILGNTFFDDVFVRKYTSPEPDVTVGIEELNP